LISSWPPLHDLYQDPLLVHKSSLLFAFTIRNSESSQKREEKHKQKKHKEGFFDGRTRWHLLKSDN
jgi:hypothetical protein